MMLSECSQARGRVLQLDTLSPSAQHLGSDASEGDVGLCPASFPTHHRFIVLTADFRRMRSPADQTDLRRRGGKIFAAGRT